VITVGEADALAKRAHGCDRTRSGSLFIDHVRRVAARFGEDDDRDAVAAALLHDSVEKGWMAWSDLRAAGADERLIEVVDALTQRDGELELQYLDRCVADPLALRIKRVDIADKLDPRSVATLNDHDRNVVHRRAHDRLTLLEELAAQPR